MLLLQCACARTSINGAFSSQFCIRLLSMSVNEDHGTGGQVQARDWRPRTSAVLESEDDFPNVQNGAYLQKPVPQPRQVRKMDHQEQMPQQQPIPVVQLAPATQRPAPGAMYVPPPGPAVQQPVQPTPVFQHMPPPYSISHGAAIQPQWQATHSVQPQPAAAPAVVTKRAVNKKTGIFKMKWKVNSMFCTIWKGILEIVARSGAIAVAVLLFALSSAVIHTINKNDALAAVDSVDSSFISTGTDLISELQSLIEGSRGVSGLMIFTAIAILIVEVPLIVGRFTLLLGIGWLRILHVVDAVCNVILAVFLLSGAASAASYSAQWSKPPPLCDDSISSAALECDQDKLTGMLGGIAFLGFIGLGITVFLTLWTIIAAVKKWDYINNENDATDTD